MIAFGIVIAIAGLIVWAALANSGRWSDHEEDNLNSKDATNHGSE